MPAALNFCSCQVSMKNPRSSPNTWGSISTISAMGVLMSFTGSAVSKLRLFVDDAQQIFTIAVFCQRLGQFHQLLGTDEPRAPGDLFHTGHFQSLSLFDDAHKHAGIEQGIVRASVEPGRAAA